MSRQESTSLQVPTRLLRWPILLPALVVTVSLVTLWMTTPMRERMVANELAGRLHNAEASQIVPTLQALLELEDSGMVALVGLLDSDHPAVVREAKKTIDELVENWRVRDAGYRSPRVATFTESLAEHTKTFRPAARRMAAQYAADIVQWPVDGKAVDRSAILVACDHVLRAAHSSRLSTERPADSQLAETRYPHRSAGDSLDNRDHNPDTISGEIDRFASLPGGGLPIQATEIPALPGRRSTRTATAPLPRPRTLRTQEARPIEQGTSPPSQDSRTTTGGKRAATSSAGEARLFSSNSDASPDSNAPPSLQWGDTRPASAELQEVDHRSVPKLQTVVPVPSKQATASNEVKHTSSVSMRELVARLASADSQVVIDTEQEIIRRGLNLLELQLADEVTLKQVRAAARQDENLKIRRLATEPSRNRIR